MLKRLISGTSMVRDTNFFINYWYNEWLLVNEKVILMVGLDEREKFRYSTLNAVP